LVYDNLGRGTSTTDVWGQVINYTYDASSPAHCTHRHTNDPATKGVPQNPSGPDGPGEPLVERITYDGNSAAETLSVTDSL